MMKFNICIIYPVDSTTNFLKQIPDELLITHDLNIFLIRPIGGISSDDIEKIKNYDLIIFLGHGHSSQLYGKKDDQKIILIDIEKAKQIFEKKKIILLACNSNQFIDGIISDKSIIITNYIGFGNMPTDWEEIIIARDYGDINYLRNLSQYSLEIYKKAITTTITYSIQYNVINNLHFRNIFLTLKTLINKEINNVIFHKELNKDEKRQLISLLIEFKSDIIYK